MKQRTIKRSRIFLLLFLGILFWGSGMKGAAKEEEKLTDSMFYSRGLVLMDGSSKRVLFGKDEDTAFPMASTTKIMTLIVALENSSMEEIVEVSSYAASMPDVQMNIREGEHYYMKDLLQALMLESYNDVAVAVAEHVAGSVENFAKMMNQKAEQIGCRHTYYLTPNGLDREDEHGVHSMSAKDLALVMRYGILESEQSEQFLEITQTPSCQFFDVEKTRQFSCINHNALLSMRKDVISGKTGFTGQAGYCYVGAAKEGDRILVIALLGCGWPPDKNRKWQDAGRLLDYGFAQYQQKNLTEGISVPESIPVEGGYRENVGLEAEIKERWMLCREEENISTEQILPKKISAPVKQGEKVGTIRVLLDGECIEEIQITTKEEIKKQDMKYWFIRFLESALL